MNPAYVFAVNKVCQTVIELLKKNPEGTEESHLFSIMASQGCNLELFDIIIKALCDAGAIKKSGNLLFA